MIGRSDNNRSERQGGFREELSAKEVRSKGTTVGTRTGSEAAMRAMSVLGNAKSNCHRKTHRVEPDGAGRTFMHLTWGDLRRESGGGVSRGRSSEERRRKAEGAKGQRTKQERTTDRLDRNGRAGSRNDRGAATAAATPAADGRAGVAPRATGPRHPSPLGGGRR
jgi:hypothetical protein